MRFSICTRAMVVVAGSICLRGVLASAQDLSKAVAALDSGRLEEAAGALAAIVREKPDDADANYYLALARFRQGRGREALPYLERATRLSPANPAPWKLSGLVFLGANDFQRASVALERACALEPESEDSCYLYGRSLFLLGRYEDAVKPFQQALRAAPPSSQAAVHRATALDLDELGSFAEAERHFREAVHLYGPTGRAEPDPRVDYGAFLVRQGRAREALDLLRAAVSASPMSARANAELGRALLELDRPEESLGLLSKAVELDPKAWSTRLLLGRAYLRLGRTEEGQRETRLGRDGLARQDYGSTKVK
jgi:Flp pilus assembly protein TadD